MDQKRIYLDSNVFISIIRKEFGRFNRPLFVEVEEFLFRAAERNDVLILSNLFFKEVYANTYCSKEDVLRHFSSLSVNVNEVIVPGKVNVSDLENVGVHYPDSLHAACAINEKCFALVTFNLKDFSPIKNLINVLAPEEY